MTETRRKPKALWRPMHTEQTFIRQFMLRVNEKRGMNLQSYEDLYQFSIGEQRDRFWEDILTMHPIIYEGKYAKVVDLDARMDSIPNWFDGLLINWAENILYTASPGSPSIRSKQGKEDDKIAVIEVTESSKSVSKFTWEQLRARVALLSDAMRAHGVKAGDRVAAVMGNSMDTLSICLAAAALGALFSTCSTDLGSKGILERLRQIEPVFVFFDDSYVYNGKLFMLETKMKEVLQALSDSKGFQALVQVNRDPSHQFRIADTAKFWTMESFLEGVDSKSTEPQFTRVPFAAGFIIVYSSGTTGAPKCLVHSVGGAVLSAWKELHLLRNLGPAGRVQQFTSTAWIMFLAKIISLTVGASILMYDGSPFFPKVDSFIQLTGQFEVTHLGVSPRYFATLQSNNIIPKQIAGLDALQLCTSTGMVLPVSLMRWFYSSKGFPGHTRLVNISGGTDIAGTFLDGNPLHPIYDVGGCQCIALGCDVRVFDSSLEADESGKAPVGREVSAGTAGDLVARLSFPNMPPYLYADPDGSKYKKAYFSRFENVWTQGDFMYVEPQTKAVVLLGRSDGVLNPSGVRFGSSEVYAVLEMHFKDEIEDSICVGQRRKGDQDENVLLFVKMKPGYQFNKKMRRRINEAIVSDLSRRHVPKFIFETKEIPTTINLKKVELPVKRIVSGEKIKPSGTLANPQSLEYFYRFVDSEKLGEQQELNESKPTSKL